MNTRKTTGFIRLIIGTCYLFKFGFNYAYYSKMRENILNIENELKKMKINEMQKQEIKNTIELLKNQILKSI